jgi:putative transposase
LINSSLRNWLTLLSVLSEIKNRGVADVCIFFCDALKGLPDGINTLWPAAIVPACVLHLIRDSFNYAGRDDGEKMAKDLRPIYQAINVGVAAAQLEEFAGIWVQKYLAIIR